MASQDLYYWDTNTPIYHAPGELVDTSFYIEFALYL